MTRPERQLTLDLFAAVSAALGEPFADRSAIFDRAGLEVAHWPEERVAWHKRLAADPELAKRFGGAFQEARRALASGASAESLIGEAQKVAAQAAYEAALAEESPPPRHEGPPHAASCITRSWGDKKCAYAGTPSSGSHSGSTCSSDGGCGDCMRCVDGERRACGVGPAGLCPC